MKPTLRGLVGLFVSRPGEWINHAELVAVGGHNYTRRISELRVMGYQIEQQGRAESSYRLVAAPVIYTMRYCRCGWSGLEHQAIGTPDGRACPRCGSVVNREKPDLQVTLL